MGSLLHPVSLRISPPLLFLSHRHFKPHSTKLPTSLYPSPLFQSCSSQSHRPSLFNSNLGPTEEESSESLVESLKVPDSWLAPSRALQESEWLRVALHKWLDDEYCPEPSNVEISQVAARSYYNSLIAKRSDLSEILLDIVGDLKSVSFQESFHGVFSSANAAVHLITLRMNSLEEQ